MAVLQQPELHTLVGDFAASYKLPVFTDTAPLGLERGLGGTSSEILIAVSEGAAGHQRAPWNWSVAGRRSSGEQSRQFRQQAQRRLQLIADQHAELEREQQLATAAADYVSRTP